MDSMRRDLYCPVFGPGGDVLDPHTQMSYLRVAHDFHPLITRQYWLNVGEGLGPGYAVHAEHHTEHKVTKVYCRHCLEVRELNGES